MIRSCWWLESHHYRQQPQLQKCSKYIDKHVQRNVTLKSGIHMYWQKGRQVNVQNSIFLGGKWEYMCKYLQNGRHSTEGFHSLLRCRYWRETKALPIISSLSLGREKRMVLQKLCRKIQPPFKLKGEIDILSANVNWPRGLTFVPASPLVLAHCTIW